MANNTQCCRICTSNRLKWGGFCSTLIGAMFLACAMFVPNLIHSEIKQGILDYIVLTPDSKANNLDGYAAWSDWTSSEAQPVFYNVRILNLTNPDEVLDGGLPVVKEVGPYVFREIKKRFNVTFDVDLYGHSIATFREWVYYVFDEKASAPLTLSDNFTSPDMVFQGLVATARDTPFLQQLIVSVYGTVKNPRDIFFKTINATGVVFGYNDPVLALFGQSPVYPGLIGNYSTIPLNQPWDAIYTGGQGEHNKARSYFQWKNMTYLEQQPDLLSPALAPLWNSPDANRIHGTDATSFRPFIQPDNITSSSSNVPPTILEAWVSDVNRTVSLVHREDVTLEGINLQRYRINPVQLLNETMNPNNAAFRMKGASGVLNLTDSNGGIPIFVTKPHYLDVDSSVSSLVHGLKPDSVLHDTFIDVEPNSGVTMNGAKRLMINLNLHPMTLKSFSGNVTWFPKLRSDVLLPLVWLEETGTISSSQANDFKNTVLLLTNFANVSYYAFYAFGNFLLALGVFCFFVSIQRKETRDLLDVNNEESNQPLYQTAPY